MARVNSAAQAIRDLISRGYTHLSPELLDPGRSGCSRLQVEEFVDSWNELPGDPYLVGSGVAGRQRRYSRFALLESGIEALPAAPFVQSDQVNPVFGGVERIFAELSPAVAASPVLASLLRTVVGCLPAEAGRTAPLDVGIHQIRVRTSAAADGLPTPEGIHQDGHRYVAQVFILRNSVDGGRSTFYQDGTAVYHTYLTEPFECLLVDDRRMHHGVSAIRPADGVLGWRDMLLLDFPETASLAPSGVVADAPADWRLLPEGVLEG
ncbi:MAG TPA: 2OG-Fe dioxygenase family protein [Jatrophihabitans sp.]|nr:2OG-Fe dioxygenase family protein [Jatrophihabitans sp.]